MARYDPSPMQGMHRVGVSAELPGLLLELGLDPHAVLAAAGTAPEVLRDPDNRIPFTVAAQLMEAAVAASGLPHVGVLLGLRGGTHSLGVVGRLMATAPTLHEAILDLVTNQVRFIRGAVTYFSMQDGMGLWGYALQAPPLRGITPIADVAMGVGVALVRELTGRDPEEVRFAHTAPRDPATFRQALGIHVVFDTEQSCLVLPPTLLAAPVSAADPALRRLLQRQIAEYWAREQPTAAEQTRRMLAAQLLSGAPTLERVAEALGLHPRTLNRRLQAEGTNFRAVLDEARHHVGCQLLATTRLSVTEIGAALGYATPPGFVRAFRRAAGQPPSEWRRAQGQ